MNINNYLIKIIDFMSVPRENADLLRAQYAAFSKQIPLMYFILVANTWALAYNFVGVAPDWLSLYVPALLSCVCLIRFVTWLRNVRKTPSDADACRALKRTNMLAGGLSVIFTAWSISLYPYGSAYAQAHVAFYMAITVIGVIFCLMHLRPAAFTVAIIVNVAFVGFFGLSNIPSFVATSINVLLVTGTMLIILTIHYRDFREMVAAKSENLRLANIDALTCLPNRRHFFACLKDNFDLAQNGSRSLVVGVLDIDGFKPVNDLYGHSTGDELLIQVGQRLSDLCAKEIYTARLGGDEFAVILPDADNEAALKLGERICAILQEPFELNGATVEVSATIGFVAYSEHKTVNETDLFERADYALYQGKNTGRGRAVMFTVDHDAEIQRHLEIEKALRTADLQEELEIFFQPIVDMRSDEIVGFEALARWNSATLGLVSPGVFIPIAERAGIIDRLTRVLLVKALAYASHWPAHMRLSFNLSAKDVSNRAGPDWLLEIIRSSGYDASKIDFEITETAMMHDPRQAEASLAALRSLGCGISLDDFGTGYSSISQLHSLPLTKIKIDRSFVSELHRKPASHKIVKSLIALARDMNLHCIVEGVETLEEVIALKGLGASLVQGYYYSTPLCHQDALDFISRHVKRHTVATDTQLAYAYKA